VEKEWECGGIIYEWGNGWRRKRIGSGENVSGGLIVCEFRRIEVGLLRWIGLGDVGIEYDGTATWWGGKRGTLRVKFAWRNMGEL